MNWMKDSVLEKGNKRIKALMVASAVAAVFLLYHIAYIMRILPYFLDAPLVY